MVTMKLVKRTAAGAALALLSSVGLTQTAEAQAPFELDTSAIGELIVGLQDVVLNLGESLGNVTEDLGQQDGLEEVLTFTGYLLTDGLVDLVQELINGLNG